MSVGGGLASPSEPESRSGTTGAGADAPATESGSDEQSMASERGSAAGASPSRGRRILVLGLIWATTVLAVVGIFAVWANRQLLNPNNWANTSSQLLENNDVRTDLSNYLSDQLHNNVNGSRIKAILPPLLQPLAAPVAAAFQNFAVTAAQRALDSQSVQTAWKDANRVTDQTFVNIVNGGSKNVQTSGGVVTLNLAAIVTDLTNRIGLPNLATKLPPNVARLKILKSDQLSLVQDVGKALKGLALLLTIIVPLLYALAIFLARGRRRRTLMNVGFALVVAGVVVLAAVAILNPAVVNSLVKVDANKPAGNAVLSIATSMLTEIAGAFIIVGVPVIAAAWFAGPARWATHGRRDIAPFLREQPVLSFAIVTVVMGLLVIWGPIPALHRPAGIIVFFVLALFGTEALRRQTAAEFPGAGRGAAPAATGAGTPA